MDQTLQTHTYMNSKRLEQLQQKLKVDPYSIYDDPDSSATHYFLVPASCDPKHFKRAFEELNGKQSNHNTTSIEGSTHRHGYINERTIRRSQKTQSFNNSSATGTNRLRTQRVVPPPPPKSIKTQTQPQQQTNTNKFPDCNTTADDDYCLIKADTKTTFKPSRTCILSNANTRLKKHQCLKRENISEFPLKKDSVVKYTGDSNTTECLKTKNTTNTKDRYIDACTCMLCIRSASYNYTGDDDGEFLEPCSCQGSTKSIIGRYMCMGLMAIFLPCMLCYLPAKACCGSRKSKHRHHSNSHKHFNDDTHVYYHSNNNKPL